MGKNRSGVDLVVRVKYMYKPNIKAKFNNPNPNACCTRAKRNFTDVGLRQRLGMSLTRYGNVCTQSECNMNLQLLLIACNPNPDPNPNILHWCMVGCSAAKPICQMSVGNASLRLIYARRRRCAISIALWLAPIQPVNWVSPYTIIVQRNMCTVHFALYNVTVTWCFKARNCHWRSFTSGIMTVRVQRSLYVPMCYIHL